MSKALSKFHLFISFLVIGPVGLSAQDYETHTYMATDSVELQLDLFLPDQGADAPGALVIFVHGGGFVGGSRDAGHGMGEYLASQNVATATITYTLSMKGRGFGCDVPTGDKVHAIRVAASQTWEATSFLLGRAQELNIDPNSINQPGASGEQ